MFWSEIGSAFEDWGNKSKKISHYFTIRERKKKLIYLNLSMVAKETLLTAVPLTERKSKLFVYSKLPNIIPCNFTTKSKLKPQLLYLQQTLTYDVLQSQISEVTLNKRKGYFKEGFLIGCCLFGLCPLCVKQEMKSRLFAKN